MVAVTGVELSVPVPLPSWPERLRPQHFTVPFERRAQVWISPESMATASVRPVTETGLALGVVEPSPRLPTPLEPQHFTDPVRSRAHVALPWAAAATPFDRPVTATAVVLHADPPQSFGPVVDPVPSWPYVLSPQHFTVPPERTAQAWLNGLTVTATASVIEETSTGIVLHTMESQVS